jgi:hypothetical protein
MIQIIPTNGKQKLFTDHHQVCDYLNSIEKQKALESGERRWMFIRRSHQTLSTFYYRSTSLRDFFTPKEKEAVDRELGLIEILKGDVKNLIQILCTPHLDIEPLKRDWNKEYCIEHGFTYSKFILKN